jgi:hypothetical protein
MKSVGGETSLDVLIRDMRPVLRGGEYVYCALPHDAPIPGSAIGVFREEEATTIILERADAEAHRLDPVYSAAWITLTIHSDMNAVGFLAAISRELAAAGISCNVMSAAYHDHLFVPYEDGERTIEVLRAMHAAI